MTELNVPAADILAAFELYKPEGITADKAVANLEAKLNDRRFGTDLDPLLTRAPGGYKLDSAAALIIDSVLSHIE